jgi:hypothetical protein
MVRTVGMTKRALRWPLVLGSAFALALAGTALVQAGTQDAKPGQFPFRSWAYAKAYTYNFFEVRPVQMRVISRDGKWSGHIRSEQRISSEQAQHAADLVARTTGSVELTRCTFPRHAIVYFDDNDRPVASVDVCFSCEAVLAWPDYERADEFDHDAAAGALVKALPAWRQLFEATLKLPIDHKADAETGP